MTHLPLVLHSHNNTSNRFQRELSALTDASADLEQKSKALEELEAVFGREKESAAELGKQVRCGVIVDDGLLCCAMVM